jgi:hypothetical protein
MHLRQKLKGPANFNVSKQLSKKKNEDPEKITRTEVHQYVFCCQTQFPSYAKKQCEHVTHSNDKMV